MSVLMIWLLLWVATTSADAQRIWWWLILGIASTLRMVLRIRPALACSLSKVEWKLCVLWDASNVLPPTHAHPASITSSWMQGNAIYAILHAYLVKAQMKMTVLLVLQASMCLRGGACNVQWASVLDVLLMDVKHVLIPLCLWKGSAWAVGVIVFDVPPQMSAQNASLGSLPPRVSAKSVFLPVPDAPPLTSACVKHVPLANSSLQENVWIVG